MGAEEQVRVVTPSQRKAGPPTAGMDRQEAFATEGMWAGFVRTEPDMSSGWHHHGEYESTIFIMSGRLRMEFGPGGGTTVDAGPGDFVFVPKRAIHRESNPASEPADIIVVRSGQGESTINVEGPA